MPDRPGAARSAWRAAALLSVVLPLVSCAAPPQKEMDQAEGAIASARAAGAAQYAAGEFSAAEAALTRSREAVDQRDYRQALNHALDARERAQTAAREAADKKAVARGQAERAITAAELALATAQQRLGAAVASGPPPTRRSTPQAATFRALQTAVASAGATLQEARSHLEAQRFDEAERVATPLAEHVQAATRAFEEAQALSNVRPARRPR